MKAQKLQRGGNGPRPMFATYTLTGQELYVVGQDQPLNITLPSATGELHIPQRRRLALVLSNHFPTTSKVSTASSARISLASASTTRVARLSWLVPNLNFRSAVCPSTWRSSYSAHS